MSEETTETFIVPTYFNQKDCAKTVEPTDINEDTIVKIPMGADKNKLIIYIQADGNLEIVLKAKGIYSDKTLTCESGKIAVLRAFESAWYKHEDGCLHLQFTPSSGATASVVATEEG